MGKNGLKMFVVVVVVVVVVVEGRQNIFRIAKQKKKERKDIIGTNYLKGDNGELLVS